MATAREIAATRLENVDAAIQAAETVGISLAHAFALFDAESEGKNIFGSDAGGMYKGQPVTEARYKKMVAAVADGKPSNGVGVTQITHRSFFPQAEEQGLKLWVPLDNAIFGFRLLKRYLDMDRGDAYAGTRYNGKESYGVTYARLVKEWKERLKGADDEETPVATWHLAPSLKKLQSDLDAEFGSNRPNDGTIGDQAHAARKSEHNPDNDADSMPKGAVSAIDIYTSANGKTWITPAEFAKFLAILKKDSRVWYVIHKGYIYSRTNNFAKEKYTGSNPHTNHIHISLVQTKAAHDNVSSWKISNVKGSSTPTTPPSTGTKKLPTLSKGDSDKVLVPFLKRFFGVKTHTDDPLFGTGLRAKVLTYQGKQGLVVDGVVGTATWKKIKSGGTVLPSGYSL